LKACSLKEGLRTDSLPIHFYLCESFALLDLANKNVEANANFSLAAKAYQDLIAAKKL
jgi:hypothetical protein